MESLLKGERWVMGSCFGPQTARPGCSQIGPWTARTPSRWFKIGCHTFRATGITIYLTNGGDLEKAQQMAAHESPRTTKLYDRAV